MDEKEEDVFQEKLELFLYGLATCAAREDNELVRGRISSLVRFIDFSNANASLVTSFPRPIASKDERNCGGYKDLARAISREMKKHREMAPIPKKSTLYVTSGSIGNLEPDFVYQMHKAMRGSTIQKKRSWRQLAYRFRCLWPSKQTALRSDLVGLSCVRGMPGSHFYGIPEASRRKMFHHSRPNPPDSRIQQTLFPTVHGKFLWNESGILYVGSHNFSKAAWGLGGMMPKNVELGVVLVSPNKKQQETWIERLPCELVAKTERSDSYKPFIGVNDPEFVDERHMGNMREIILEESSMVLEKLIL